MIIVNFRNIISCTIPKSCITSNDSSDANATDSSGANDNKPINSELNSSDILHPLESISMVYFETIYLNSLKIKLF